MKYEIKFAFTLFGAWYSPKISDWSVEIMKKKTMALIFAAAFMLSGCSAGGTVETVTLGESSLKNTVSSTGYIQSTDETNVYSTLAYTIKNVNVEVGDKISAGEVLCELDTALLEAQITSAKTALNSSSTSTDYALSQGEKDYLKMKNELESGTYQPLVLAERSVEYAEEALKIAQKAYDDKVNELADGSDLTIKAKSSALQLAQSTVDINFNTFKEVYSSTVYDEYVAKKYSEVERTRRVYLKNRSDENRGYYDEAVNNLNEMVSVNKDISAAWQTLYASIVSCDAAQLDYEMTLAASDDMVESLQDALTNAQMNYDGAVRDLESAKTEANKALEDLRKKLDNDIAVTDFSAQVKNLENLEKDLEDCTVKAETDGTVTAVYAKEGDSGAGILFVIENTDDLEVLAKFKEYDIASLDVGMPVIVKTDATGSEEYEGVITKIAPTAVKGGTGADTEFEVNIGVKSEGTKLKIGMKAKVEVVIEEKNSIYSVPIDAVRYDEDDEAYIFIAIQDGKDYTVKKIGVSTGMLTDTEIEIYGSELTSGMTVIADDSETITAGSSVKIK